MRFQMEEHVIELEPLEDRIARVTEEANTYYVDRVLADE
jgi:hypothetical protein